MFTNFSKNVMFYNTIGYAHGGSVFLFLNLSMIVATIYGFVLLPAVSRNKSNVDKYHHKSLMTLRWGRNFFKITRILVATFLVCFLPWFVYFGFCQPLLAFHFLAGFFGLILCAIRRFERHATRCLK